MRVYQQTADDDLLLLQWWEALVRCGELEKTLGKESLAIARFYSLFRPPHVFLYEADDQGIWLAFLLSPVMRGAALSLWLAPRKRRARLEALPVIELAYETAFGEVPVILGITRQERLLAAHLRWGYEVVGEVPALFDGETAWVLYLTEPLYRAAKARRHKRERGNGDGRLGSEV